MTERLCGPVFISSFILWPTVLTLHMPILDIAMSSIGMWSVNTVGQRMKEEIKTGPHNRSVTDIFPVECKCVHENEPEVIVSSTCICCFEIVFFPKHFQFQLYEKNLL